MIDVVEDRAVVVGEVESLEERDVHQHRFVEDQVTPLEGEGRVHRHL